MTIRWASPSATAVFPTPDSPISTGLFFVRRHRIRITCSSSFSRPNTGSSLSCPASSFRLRPNPFSSFKAFCISASAFSFLAWDLNLFFSGREWVWINSSCIMTCTRFMVILKRPRTREATQPSSASKPSRMCPEPIR